MVPKHAGVPGAGVARGRWSRPESAARARRVRGIRKVTRRQSEVCERNTRVDVRALLSGATRHPYKHSVERAHSHRLIAIVRIHIGFNSSHMHKAN